MCRDPAQKGLGALRAPLTSPQEDAEKHLSLFPSLEQGDVSSSLGALQKCYVSHQRAAKALGPWWGAVHTPCYASEQASSSSVPLQQCQEEVLYQGDNFPFFLRHFKRMNNSS